MKIFAQRTNAFGYGVFVTKDSLPTLLATGLTFKEADKSVRLAHLVAELCGQKIELTQENLDFYQDNN